ncbi:MAG: heavy-metal-associated domain-containing protein [Bacteroidota bacterium]
MKLLLITMLMSVLCCLAPSRLSAQNTTAATEAPTAVSMVQTTTVRVKGVSCSTDIKTIKNKVSEVKGIISCETIKRGAITHFEVKYYPSIVSLDTIHQAVEQTPGCKGPDDLPYRVKL